MTVLLIISSFFTSMVSAIIGMGGGIMLISIMGPFFPPNILIPIHGIIQFGSNTSRSLAFRQFINWKMVLPFILGTVLGAAVGSQL